MLETRRHGFLFILFYIKNSPLVFISYLLLPKSRFYMAKQVGLNVWLSETHLSTSIEIILSLAWIEIFC